MMEEGIVRAFRPFLAVTVFFLLFASQVPAQPTPTPGPPEAAFAVGGYVNPDTSESYVKIFQRHGMRWLDVSPLLPGGLSSVRVVSDTEAWAAGSGNNYLLALRWDGTTWTDVSQVVEGEPSDIDGLPGGRAVVVGSRSDAGGDWMKIWEWDGAAWTDVSPGIEGSLNSVDLVSGSDGYAVGSVYDSVVSKTYVKILKWDGAAWTDISPAGIEGDLRCVRMLGPGEGYAAGKYGADDFSHIRIIKCTGGAWTSVFFVDGGTPNIFPVSMTEVYMAGGHLDEDLAVGYPVIKRWDGSALTDISPSGGDEELRSIWMRSSSEGCAVGGGWGPVPFNSHVQIFEYDGSSWIDVSPGSEGRLESVSLSPTPPNYVTLGLEPAQVKPGGGLAVRWRCDFGRWNYRGRPVDVYLAAIRNPRSVGSPSTIEEALGGGEVYLFADGMARAYRYSGAVSGPTWKRVSFPPVGEQGVLNFTTPSDAYFEGGWVFATAFLYSDGSGPVRGDLPVENSNLTTLAP